MSEASPSTSRPPVSHPKYLQSEVASTAKQKKAGKRFKRPGKDNNLDTTKEIAVEGLPREEKKSKKRKREVERSVDDHDPEDSEKKAKKKLDRAEESQSDPANTSDVVAPTKKRKNKTGFPDPDEDVSLPEQSKKCLAYAFLQFHRPSKWKFNKARQNWILRNIWSSEMIPETHLPLAYGYLMKIQGGVRESCRTALENHKTEATLSEKADLVDGASADTKSTTMIPPTSSAAESTKEIRAQELIDLLSTSDTSVS
ncbi:hypothetical protein J132_07940 [Termitomyces sp. J132]|nr:hypothetical protein J132_07940 [Termitomyces sp. J132]